MTNEQREIITRLRREGQGYTAIARAAGLSKESVKGFCRRNDLGGVLGKNPVISTVPGACRNCGKTIIQIPHRKQRRFCCDDCRRQWWNSHPEAVHRKAIYSFVCPVCGQPFTAYGNAGRKYCSRACFAEARKHGGDTV